MSRLFRFVFLRAVALAHLQASTRRARAVTRSSNAALIEMARAWEPSVDHEPATRMLGHAWFFVLGTVDDESARETLGAAGDVAFAAHREPSSAIAVASALHPRLLLRAPLRSSSSLRRRVGCAVDSPEAAPEPARAGSAVVASGCARSSRQAEVPFDAARARAGRSRSCARAATSSRTWPTPTRASFARSTSTCSRSSRRLPSTARRRPFSCCPTGASPCRCATEGPSRCSSRAAASRARSRGAARSPSPPSRRASPSRPTARRCSSRAGGATRSPRSGRATWTCASSPRCRVIRARSSARRATARRRSSRTRSARR